MNGLYVQSQVAEILFQQSAKSYGLLTYNPPYYKFQVPLILENKTTVLYQEKGVMMDKTIDFNKPDIQ